MQPLSGKRAVVVGIAGDYASIAVRALRGAGATVAIVDQDRAALRRFSELVAADLSLVCDMSEAGIGRVFGELEGRGHVIDILVTCPPVSVQAPGRSNARFLRETLGAVVELAFLWTAVAAPVMRLRRSGVIVHLSGLSGLGGWRGWQAAGAAFAGVHNLVQSFALELAVDSVRVNALVPGVNEAQAQQIADAAEQSVAAVQARIPLNAFMPDEALGNALLYLVHPSSSYVTGEVLTVDGGWNMWGRLHAVAT